MLLSPKESLALKPTKNIARTYPVAPDISLCLFLKFFNIEPFRIYEVWGFMVVQKSNQLLSFPIPILFTEKEDMDSGKIKYTGIIPQFFEITNSISQFSVARKSVTSGKSKALLTTEPKLAAIEKRTFRSNIKRSANLVLHSTFFRSAFYLLKRSVASLFYVCYSWRLHLF